MRVRCCHPFRKASRRTFSFVNFFVKGHWSFHACVMSLQSCRYKAGMMLRDVKPRKASECVRWLRITVRSETGFVHSNLGRRSLRRRNGAGRHCVNGGNAQREILPTHCAPEMLKHMLQILQRMCQGGSGSAARLRGEATEEKRPRRSDRGRPQAGCWGTTAGAGGHSPRVQREPGRRQQTETPVRGPSGRKIRDPRQRIRRASRPRARETVCRST